MKISREFQKLRGERLNSVLERYNLKPSELATDSGPDAKNPTIKITPSEVSGWLVGGYGETGKGYLSDGKARDVIFVLKTKHPHIPEIRLSYLLGTDKYMTDSDWINEVYEMRNIVADSMWAIIEKSLAKRGKHLCFVHRQNQHIDATQRIRADCYYTITDNDGKVLKRMSAIDLVRFEEKIQDYCDFLTEKYL